MRISVLGGFHLTTGQTEVRLPVGAKRLSALLALQTGESTRAAVAGTLWPETTEREARASLRASLFRLRHCSAQLIDADGAFICLAKTVTVDLHDSMRLAHQLLDAGTTGVQGAGDIVRTLSTELLPGWYDDWVIPHAEMWRQLRLHALEAFAHDLVVEHCFGQAATAASAAIVADPLRESARAALITVHRAEGNVSEAWREFDLYRCLLRSELGVDPTPRLRKLAGDPASPVADFEPRRQSGIVQTSSVVADRLPLGAQRGQAPPPDAFLGDETQHSSAR